MNWLNLVFPEPHELANLSLGKARKRIRNYLNAGPTEHPWVTAVFDYSDPQVLKLVRVLKNRPHPRLLRLSAEIMHENIKPYISDQEVFQGKTIYLIVPIPSHQSKLRQRGFNQAVKIAKALARQDKNFKFYDGLAKTRKTPKQALLKRKLRLKNLKEAFTVKNPDRVKNRHIILVDDIITTGATLNEAKKILLEAGAKNVSGCTLAYST